MHKAIVVQGICEICKAESQLQCRVVGVSDYASERATMTLSDDFASNLRQCVCPNGCLSGYESEMPGIVKKLVIIAAVEGLILHPAGQRNQRSLQIKYTTHEISPLASSTSSSSLSCAEFHGVVGSRYPVSSLDCFTDSISF